MQPTRSADRQHSRRSAAQWRVIVQRYERSGLSQADFCRREKLSLTSFGRWRQRLSATDDPPGFVELHAEAAVRDQEDAFWTLEIDLPGGGSLRLRSSR